VQTKKSAVCCFAFPQLNALAQLAHHQGVAELNRGILAWDRIQSRYRIANKTSQIPSTKCQ
jgi:hypothetical protein